MQFENPAVETHFRLRRIFLPEQYFLENLLGKVLVGHGRAHGSRRRDLLNNHEIWDFAMGLGSFFSVENLATRMF